MSGQIPPAVNTEYLEALYAQFLDDVTKVQEKTTAGDRLSGWFTRSRKFDPLQERFAEDMENAMKALYDSAPDSQAVKDVLLYVYTKHVQVSKNHPSYLMILAVHRYTMDLIGLLDPKDAADLLEIYQLRLPKKEQMPVNTEVAKLLKKQAK